MTAFRNSRRWSKLLVAASLAGALAVGLGAFGAHALTDKLDPRSAELWRTANLYHFWHAILLMVYALAGSRTGHPCWWRGAGALLFGMLLFSGSLYGMALSASDPLQWLVWLTPLGGLGLILGWLLVIPGLRGHSGI